MEEGQWEVLNLIDMSDRQNSLEQELYIEEYRKIIGENNKWEIPSKTQNNQIL